ncbi:serine hydrolase domain-containing protein [Paenibacillus dakarensis]|uniref:serine hydrolase domain-containing protein n=1 Tax=Paenibacillus dakarensis TaxID=1527293 RepID=UPI0014791504|nr:serine hydrolase domain-containing protein [Paenibacillus dakarensis]
MKSMALKKRLYGTSTLFAGVVLLILIITVAVCWNQLGNLFMAGKYDNEEDMVKTIMAKSATPGAAVVISNQGETEFKAYGYADIQNKKMVNEESLFELGSTTKAFTALSVILLENEGLLKYSDLITDYLPWFEPTFKGEQAKITINQLLAHTSGIPPWTIRLIPEGSTDDMLEKTIHNVSEIELDSSPGTEYSYATINYDVLAMIIEKVTGKSYQDYVTENILLPLGMTDSYFSTGQELEPDHRTKGYRILFGKDMEYDAPRYYGNIAAGYLVTNLKDLEHWIHAQLGMGDLPNNLKEAIQESHEVDLDTAGHEGNNQFYSFGWSVDTKNKVITHAGSNPNYSSHVIVDLEKQRAVFVLTNANSTAPSLIADNLFKNINGNSMKKYRYDDTYVLMDLVFSILVILAVISLCLKIIKLAGGIRLYINDGRTRTRKVIGNSIALIFRSIFLILLIIWPYLINNNYYMISVWMSYSLLIWIALAAINCILSIIIHIKKIAIIRRS